MQYIITGATGHFGRVAIETLLDRGIPATEIVAIGRSVEKISDLAGRGVRVIRADYNDPESLRTAFAGGGRLLLVSASEVGSRLVQHRNIIDAALASGVEFIAYTSLLNARDGGLKLAEEHIATEDAIAASGIPAVILRNGWYLENYTGQLPGYLHSGAVLGSAGEGRLNAATRSDLAIAAAAVISGEGHEGRIYELGGDEAFTLGELAATITEVTGTEVVYRDLPAAEFESVLVQAGVPGPFAAILADTDQGIARGALATDSTDLHQLLERDTTSVRSAVEAAL
ncbi:SDR family oxidoreductase [Corynebacterium pacaense]|uniref:SDR family oxidoreductase n=1 Tax=Corynebacterium pacaense TaxID=1816684 RepID=UPI0009B9D318|nr:SDR family oxidoreductase [Corynebacterium pacaense]